MVKPRRWRGQLEGGRRGPQLIQGVQATENTPQPGLSLQVLGRAEGMMLGAGEEQRGWRCTGKSPYAAWCSSWVEWGAQGAGSWLHASVSPAVSERSQSSGQKTHGERCQ